MTEEEKAARRREYYEANKERIKARQREYYRKNREARIAYQREVYARNGRPNVDPEKERERSRKYYAEHREEISERRKQKRMAGVRAESIPRFAPPPVNEEETIPVCPICGKECETVYYATFGAHYLVGCDCCITSRDAADEPECYEERSF